MFSCYSKLFLVTSLHLKPVIFKCKFYENIVYNKCLTFVLWLFGFILENFLVFWIDKSRYFFWHLKIRKSSFWIIQSSWVLSHRQIGKFLFESIKVKIELKIKIYHWILKRNPQKKSFMTYILGFLFKYEIKNRVLFASLIFNQKIVKRGITSNLFIKSWMFCSTHFCIKTLKCLTSHVILLLAIS